MYVHIVLSADENSSIKKTEEGIVVIKSWGWEMHKENNKHVQYNRTNRRAHEVVYNDKIMTIAKNIEVSSTSEKSFEDAIQKGVARIAKTVNNVQGAWVKEQKVGITDGKINKYHVIMIVSFVINEDTDLS